MPRKLVMHIITYLLLPFKRNAIQRKKLFKYSLVIPNKVLRYYLILMGNYMLNKKASISQRGDYLFLMGEYDVFFLSKIKKCTKNERERLVVIKGASHLCNNDDSAFVEVYNKHMREFLGYNKR